MAQRIGRAGAVAGMPRAMGKTMRDQRRELLALRLIVVSGRAALRKTSAADDRELIKNRITELFAQFEEAVLQDGADPAVLARLAEGRREVWE
jgi:hypothetical protein